MQRIVNIHEAKSRLSQLIVQALAGKRVVIAKAGKPVVKMVAYKEPAKSRKPGLWKGKVWVSPDFDEEDPEINKMFYGEE